MHSLVKSDTCGIGRNDESHGLLRIHDEAILYGAESLLVNYCGPTVQTTSFWIMSKSLTYDIRIKFAPFLGYSGCTQWLIKITFGKSDLCLDDINHMTARCLLRRFVGHIDYCQKHSTEDVSWVEIDKNWLAIQESSDPCLILTRVIFSRSSQRRVLETFSFPESTS